ncbi:hypothetical protein ACQP3C_30940, partial [Escherichia coli]
MIQESSEWVTLKTDKPNLYLTHRKTMSTKQLLHMKGWHGQAASTREKVTVIKHLQGFTVSLQPSL